VNSSVRGSFRLRPRLPTHGCHINLYIGAKKLFIDIDHRRLVGFFEDEDISFGSETSLGFPVLPGHGHLEKLTSDPTSTLVPRSMSNPALREPDWNTKVSPSNRLSSWGTGTSGKSRNKGRMVEGDVAVVEEDEGAVEGVDWPTGLGGGAALRLEVPQAKVVKVDKINVAFANLPKSLVSAIPIPPVPICRVPALLSRIHANRDPKSASLEKKGLVRLSSPTVVSGP